MEPSPATGRVRRRRLFYIAGYDPRSPGLSHILYRDESAKQAAALGGARTVGPAERIGREAIAWEVEDCSGTRTRIELLRWDDIVRAHWHASPWAVWRAAMPFYGGVLVRGFAIRMARWAPWCAFTMLLPGLALLVVAVGMISAAWIAWALAATAGAPSAAGVVLAVAAAAGLGWVARIWLSRIPGEWILRAMIFMRDHGRGDVPDLERRIDAMAARVRAACDDPGVDEVLVTGHSVGAQIAAQVVARAGAGPRVSLLTLGHTIPMTAWWSERASIRADLRTLAVAIGMPWLDVTAPPDGASMALADPVAASGLPPTGRPRCIPARFHRQFDPATYRRIRRDKFRLHFQYLMAAEKPGGFDWFALSAGPRRLSDWIADEDRGHARPT
ncbi:MAG: hypothetical protein RLZZ127_890 [Planctomycetota bacterium]|jgi:hypothetical protein